MLVLTRHYGQAIQIGPLRLVVADGVGPGITLYVNQPPSGHTERHRLAPSNGVAIGYGVALAAQLLVFPLYGMEVSLSQNIQIGAIFTVVSIARSYAVRRVFNRVHGVR